MTESDVDRARREWEESAGLVTYAAFVAERLADAHRETLIPGPSLPNSSTTSTDTRKARP